MGYPLVHTFAELDRRVSRLASGLRELIGGDGSVVAVSSVLGLDFPIAYYAIARSGNVIDREGLAKRVEVVTLNERGNCNWGPRLCGRGGRDLPRTEPGNQ